MSMPNSYDDWKLASPEDEPTMDDVEREENEAYDDADRENDARDFDDWNDRQDWNDL